MSLDLLSKTRWLSLAAMLGLASATSLGGCAVDADRDDVEEVGVEGASTDAITNVNHSKVKRQSIGNCWLYATVSWVEALNKMATGTEANVSESYLTFWHWFDQIANGATGDEVSTGGSFGVAAEIINRYGLMLEKDFIPAEADSEMSNRQASALSAINTSLKTGALKDPAARGDRAKVLAELEKAWNLDANVKTMLHRTFGTSVTRTIDKSYTTKRTPTTGKILRAKDFQAKVKDSKTAEWKTGSLQDAIGTRGYSTWAPRTGAFAWNEVDYPYDAKSRRNFMKRVQRALHDGQPVIISWFVDFNALSSSSTFSLEEIARRGGPGRQGGHMTVLHDYEITNVPGFGTLKAGQEASPEALTAALADTAQITFLRIKNSWGGYRPDRWNDAVLPGYHDLTSGYLNGPVKKCEEKNGVTDTTNCTNHTPLWEVVLPAGY
ncbi:MAG: hypothetical protein HYV09_27380 [Deltaproteobacteria bacterium]|nr:hypothetical protein [Deltaproteobacteria bacterium]